jgi:phosphoribosylanthranilate isomerase
MRRALGASYVGFVLWPTARAPHRCERSGHRSGVAADVTPVGVFVDPTADEIKRAADAGIQMAQVHSEAPSFLPRADSVSRRAPRPIERRRRAGRRR